MRLQLLNADDGVTTELVLGSEPIFVGRSPANDLVVRDPSVSGRHVSIYVAADAVVVEDLASRNGTFYEDGRRVLGVCRVSAGVALRLGTDTHLRITADAEADAPEVLLVEATDGPGAVPMRGERFRIGSGPDCDLRASLPGDAVAVIERAEGGLTLVLDGLRTALTLGEPFAVPPLSLVLRPAPVRVGQTLDIPAGLRPAALELRLDGTTGASAWLVDGATGSRHQVHAENRVMVLFVLAEARLRDLEARVAPEDCGWVPDEDVATGVWGKRAGRNKNLNVLVTRIRNELRDAGFDGGIVEKRRGHTRLTIGQIDIA